MQTERVTFLTSPDQKAALDTFAKQSGMSVGHLVRQATTMFMAEAPLSDDDRMAILVGELNEALPAIEASFDRMSTMVREARAELQRLREERKALS